MGLLQTVEITLIVFTPINLERGLQAGLRGVSGRPEQPGQCPRLSLRLGGPGGLFSEQRRLLKMTAGPAGAV